MENTEVDSVNCECDYTHENGPCAYYSKRKWVWANRLQQAIW